MERPYSLTFAELLAMPLVERDITLTCVSNEVGGPYVGGARWLGVRTKDLLERAGVKPGVEQIFSHSTEGMTISTPVQALTDDREALVAIAMNGEPLPAMHGFPARLVTPGLYGFVGATKWLTRMQATTYGAQSAYWTDRGWATDAPILTQSRIDTPRGLNRLDAGRVVIGGVAWAQQRGIQKVEVRVDDGAWQEAKLGPDGGIDYWRQWYLPWDALPGRHQLTVRATDLEGQTQPEQDATPFPKGATGWHGIARHHRVAPDFLRNAHPPALPGALCGWVFRNRSGVPGEGRAAGSCCAANSKSAEALREQGLPQSNPFRMPRRTTCEYESSPTP